MGRAANTSLHGRAEQAALNERFSCALRAHVSDASPMCHDLPPPTVVPPSDTHIRMDFVHKILEGKIVRHLHILWRRYSLKDDCQDFEGQKLAERIYTLALAAITVRSGPKI